MGLISDALNTDPVQGPQVRTPSVPAVQGGPSVGGFLGNLGGDVIDLARGTGSLLGMLVHDAIVNPIREVTTLGKADTEYATDDFLKALPGAVLKDYKTRYGFEGADDVARELYENPLSYILDALAVVNAGGKLGSIAAARSPEFAATKLGQLATAKPISTVAPFGITKADIEPTTALNRLIVPDVEHPLVRQMGTSGLPTRRLYQRAAARFATESPDDFAKRIEQMYDDYKNIEAGDNYQNPTLLETIRQHEEALSTARELGLRIEKPKYTAHRIARATDQLLGQTGLRHVMERDRLAALFNDIYRRTDLQMPPEYLPDVLMGLEPKMLADSWAGTKGVADLAGLLASPQRNVPTKMLRDTEDLVIPELDDPRLRSFDLGSNPQLTADPQEVMIAATNRLVNDRRVGPHPVVTPRVKTTASRNMDAINAQLLGQTPDTSDVVGISVLLNDWRELPRMVRNVQDVLGPIVRLKNHLLSVAEDGRRQFRATYLMDGQPVEVRFGTQRALDVDAAQSKLSDFYDAAKARVDSQTFDEVLTPDYLWREIDASRRMMSHLTGAITDELRGSFLGQRTSPLRDLMHETRIGVAREFEAKLFEPGTLRGFTPAQALERMYRPVQAWMGAELAPKNGGWVLPDGTPIEQHPTLASRALDDVYSRAGIAPPVYFPFYDEALAGKQSRLWLLARGQGARQMAKPGYTKALTGELLKQKRYIRDPRRAYALRAAEQVRLEESLNLVDELVTNWGRRIDPKNPLDHLGAHEVVFAPDGFARLIRTKARLDRAAIRAELGMSELDDPIRAFVNEVIDVANDNVNEMLTLTKQGVELYAVPRIVTERIEKSIGPRLGLKTRLFWDKPTELWRTWVLGGSPRWILNNTVGNSAFLKMQGGRISDVLRQMVSPAFRKRLDLAIGESARQFTDQGFIRTEARGTHIGYGAVAGDPVERTVANLYQRMGESRLTSVVGRFPDAIKRWNTEVETAFRRASYLTAAQRQTMKAGMRRTIDRFWTSKKTLDDVARLGADDAGLYRAVDEMNYWLNDYSQSTPFARNYLRRFIMPFWAFYRHIGKLVFRMPLDYPNKGAVMRMFAEVANDMGEHFGPLPLWAEGAFPLHYDEQTGETKFLSTVGMNPFSLAFGTPLDLLHPAFKMAYEQSTGQSAYRHREFSDPSVFTPFGSSQQYRVSQDPAGNWNAEPIERTAPGILEHVLQQFPFYQQAKNLLAGATTYDTADILDVALMRMGAKPEEAVLPVDPATGEPRYKRDLLDEWMRFWGLPTFNVNQSELQTQRYEDQLAALRGIMRRFGYLPPPSPGGSSTPASAPAVSLTGVF